MNNINPITLIMTAVFLYPILKGFLFKFSSQDLKFDIEETNRSISFIVSLLIGSIGGKKIFLQHEEGIYKSIYYSMPKNIINYIENKPIIIYLVLIPLLIFIIYKITFIILHLINSITFYPVLDRIERHLRSKSNIFKRIMGAISQIPKAIAFILIVVFALNVGSMFYTNSSLNKYLNESQPYKYVCKEFVIPITNSKLARKLPKIIDNSFKIVSKDVETNKKTQNNIDRSRTIVYYNGVTLNEGVKSNKEINDFARFLVKDETVTRKKAQILYNWIGSNVSYDYDKANKVLNDDFNVSSGAIPTFNTKKGICFDYSCLYVAMCKANGMHVRLVTGMGFNGLNWVSHAWNEVYLPEEDTWINVDSTFYKGGNYFDSKRFNLDHKDNNIAGEW